MTHVHTDPRCATHRCPAGYPERPERLSAVLEHLGGRGRTVNRGDGAIREEERVTAAVEAVHDPAYVARFRAAVERGDGLLDSADNPLSAGTWTAAHGGVAATLAAADSVAGGEPAFAAVRPPGHHAERATAMGFCFFNNVAVAAQYLQSRHGLDRVAIFDFDVHHGNGTQHLFEARGDILYASTHQYPYYPGTGAAGERGTGDGEGATVNVPFQIGSGEAEIFAALDETILPAITAFRPQALLVSAGFDAWRGDPLGGLRWELATYHTLGRRLAEVAEGTDCALFSVLEGGYDLFRLGALVEAYLLGSEGKCLDQPPSEN